MKCQGLWVSLILLMGLTASFAASGLAADNPPLDLEPGPHAVGYRVDYASDPARSFGPRQDLDGHPFPRPLSRPVQVHLWYPAADADGPPLRYRDYVLAAAGLYESSPAQNADARTAEVLSDYKAHPLGRGADEGKLDAILGRKVRARRDAAPAAGPFPLILYAPSINSDPFENALLFEYLASHGYVVAAAPSVGLREPEVSRDRAGAEAQVGDLGFVMARAWDAPWVDRARIGVMGFSWGGMTALLFAIPHAGIDAVVCLDGAATMDAYRPVAESFACWVPRELRAALLQIVLADEPRDLGFAAEAKYADTYTWRLPGIVHRDFGADQLAKYRLAAEDPDAARASGTWGAVAQRVEVFFDAYLLGDARSLRVLREEAPPLAGADWAFQSALPAPPTAAQFDEVIEKQGVDAAVELFHALRKVDPGVIVFDEQRLPRFAVLWGPERSEELLRLLELNLEAYPRSAETHYWLGQVHLTQEDEAAAERELKTVLDIDPEHARARTLLEKLAGAR